ncbi:MAG: beta-propeller domain-containing protein [Oligoflexales bacterium]|nr:beta-propeller domain-containing protein [Oligoflexales bacterium]
MFQRNFRDRIFGLSLLVFLSSNCGGYKGFMQDHFGAADGSGEGKKSGVYSFKLLPEPKAFKSCQEMDSYFAEIKAAYDADHAIRSASQNIDYSTSSPKSTAETSAPAAAGKAEEDVAQAASQDGLTNVQEAGVDEADMVKVSEKNIYILVDNKIKIVDRKTLKEVDELFIKDFTIQDIYINDNKLVLIGSEYIISDILPTPDPVPVPIPVIDPAPAEPLLPLPEPAMSDAIPFEGDEFVSQYQHPDTLVLIYQEASAGHKLEKIAEHRYTGYLNSSRLTEDFLYLVINDDLSYPFELATKAAEPISAKLKNLACEDVQVPVVNDYDLRLTKIVSLSLLDEKATANVVGIIGGGDHLYMTRDSLYLAKQGLQWIPWLGGAEMDAEVNNAPRLYEEWTQKLSISRIKFDLKSGKLVLSSVGSINGYVKDQWSFKEYADNGGTLVVAATRDVYENANADEMMWNPPTQTNDLFVLAEKGQKLETIAKIEDFGRTENIRSVRFVDRTAYVVTFRQTDPLFAFDLTDLNAPKLLGELKIPGFSAYMHPLADGRLLGLGYDANDWGGVSGIQVSLFDVSNPLDLQRLDVHVHGEAGSSSEAVENHHAFFHDAESNIVAFPLSIIEQGAREFQGAIIYDVQDKLLVETARLDHQSILPAACKAAGSEWWSYGQSININRIIKLDGKLLTISRFGIKAHSLSDYSETAVTKFSGDYSMDCQAMPYYME